MRAYLKLQLMSIRFFGNKTSFIFWIEDTQSRCFCDKALSAFLLTCLVVAHMFPFPPSSPSMALFKNGELVHMLERHHIEGRPAELIAENLKGAYEEFC